MSTFLGYQSFLQSLGSSITDVQTTMAGVLTGYNWQVISKSIVPQAITGNFGDATYVNANALSNNDFGGLAASCGSNNAFPKYLQVQMPAAVTITSYSITASTTGYHQSPKNWTLEYSDDGTTWATASPADTRTNEIGWSLGEIRNYTVTTPSSHPYWRLAVTASNGAYAGTPTYSCYIQQFRMVTSTGYTVSNACYLYVTPPTGELIGNSYMRELVNITITGTQISCQPVTQMFVNVPHVLGIQEKTAGAVVPSLYLSDGSWFPVTASISGTTLTVTATSGVIGIGSLIQGNGTNKAMHVVGLGTGTGGNGTYVLDQSYGTYISGQIYMTGAVSVAGAIGNAGSTAKDNLRSLYTALKTSVTAPFNDFKWFYQKPSPQNANDTTDWIVGVRQSDAPMAAAPYLASPNVNAMNITYRTKQTLQTSGLTSQASTAVTIDLINGFIFYFQVNSRSFAIATKTNANYFGPTHCCYADHTKALASVPTGIIDSRLLGPIELAVGTDGLSTTCDSTAYFSRLWRIDATFSAWNYQDVEGVMGSSYTCQGGNVFGAGRIRNIIMDGSGGQYNSGGSCLTNAGWSATLKASGYFSGSSDGVADEFQIHRAGLSGVTTTNTNSPYTQVGTAGNSNTWSLPFLDIQDWYKFRGTATNEGLCLVADTVGTTTLSADLSAVAVTIPVVSTAGFPSAGFVIIESEYIQYTGTTGTSFTGCTRGKYGTVAVNHYNGDIAAPGLWMTIINGGALFAGYTKPA